MLCHRGNLRCQAEIALRGSHLKNGHPQARETSPRRAPVTIQDPPIRGQKHPPAGPPPPQPRPPPPPQTPPRAALVSPCRQGTQPRARHLTGGYDAPDPPPVPPHRLRRDRRVTVQCRPAP